MMDESDFIQDQQEFEIHREEIVNENEKDLELLKRKDSIFDLKNHVAFAEDFYGVKLYPWQKALLNAWIEKGKEFISNIPYRKQKQMLSQAQLEYMKAMEMDFQVWKPDCIEEYKKGVLVKTIRKEKNDERL